MGHHQGRSQKDAQLDKEKGKIGGATNSSFLALILKEKNPNSVDIFRPISLCNTSYKILTKIMATKMKNLVKHIILDSQGGFVVG